jgi:hypothetical protein
MNMDSGDSGRSTGAIGKLWALTVGINRYRSFPPLQYARQDAEGLFHFLQRYRQLAPGRGILLTDVSPDQPVPLPWALTDTQSTLPSRENWWSWLQALCTTDLLQPEDVLWVSFSGYAIHYQNEDYLIPWDGDPKAIVETAISVRSLLNLLHGARTSRILLLLDMSRSQGIFAPEQRPGQQTAQLVTQFGIPTLLSCQPYQFAHESADLHLGLFTAALLEGLRIHRLDTLGEIALYLSDRVPQLCDLHWKPLQIPLGIGSPGFPVYPQGQPAPSRGEVSGITPILIPVTTPQGSPQPEPVPATAGGTGSGQLGSGPLTPTLPVFPWTANRGEGQPPAVPPTTNGTPDTRIPDRSFQPRFQYTPPHPQRSLQRDHVLRWFVVAAVVIGGVLLWQRLGTKQRLFPTSWFQRPEALPSGVTDQRLLYAPLPSPTQAPSPTPETLALENQKLLREARTLFRESQASHFSDGIGLLRQIQPGEPLYEQAQADIDRWSQMIFDFALGRAQEKDYAGAIEAARLVPWDQAQYQDAQAAISYWQGELSLQTQINGRLDQAQAIIRPDSASSYSDAIGLLGTIPEAHPDYEEAQALIEEWSVTILSLAEDRAAQGNYSQAIEAAELVPAFTAEYKTAQDRIKAWRE